MKVIKEETLKEAAERLTYHDTLSWENTLAMESFKLGAKWQQKRMYSEEDMIKAIKFGSDGMYGWQLGEEGYTVNQIERFLKTLK